MHTLTFALVHNDPGTHTHTLERDRCSTVSIPEAQEKRGGGEKERETKRKGETGFGTLPRACVLIS